MKRINQQHFEGERSLFQVQDIEIENSVFENGESPLKESSNITLKNSVFRWKYPLWYSKNIVMNQTTLVETARSGIWYSRHLEINDSMIEAPKTFRRSKHIILNKVNMPNALESFWNCQDIFLNQVSVKGDYFGFNSQDIVARHLNLSGNYSFDGCQNIEIHDSILVSKDAFWNCKNVTVYNSTIIGEYLGWNSENVTFINCTIESLQGLCYMKNLKMENCKLINTTLAFEYSSVDATIDSHIESITNPLSGRIEAISIGEIILDESKIDPSQTEIVYHKQHELTVQECCCA